MSIKNEMIILRQLLCFMETAKRGQISATAIEHGLKQSNLSNSIKELEDALDIKLFNRVHNGVALTSNGKELLKITAELENVLEKIDRFSTDYKNIVGKVFLLMQEGFASLYISQYLSDFYAQYPNVQVDLGAESFVNNFDVAVTHQKIDEMICYENYLDLGLFASKEYLDRYGYPKNTKDLLDNHKICLDYQNNGVLKGAKNIVVSTNSANLLLQLAKDGAGIAMLPLKIGCREKAMLSLASLGISDKISFWVVVNPKTAEQNRVKVFAKYLLNIIKKNIVV